MARPAAAVMLLALAGSLERPARAAEEWRYCLAQDETSRRVYMTEAFPTATTIEGLERAFNAWLDASGLPHRWGICPRSSSPFEAAADLQSATRYNRMLGLEPHPVAWPDTHS